VATLDVVDLDAQPTKTETEDPLERTSSIRLTPVFAFALVGSIVAGYIIQRSFILAHRTLGWAVACAVVALLLEPLVQRLSTRLPRVVAIILAVLSIVGIAGVVVFRIVREITASVRSFRDAAPLAASRFEGRSRIARDLHLGDTIKAFSDQLANDLNQETVSRVKTAPTYLITAVLMLFLLVNGRRYIESGVAQIRDSSRREKVRGIVEAGLVRGRNRLLLVVLQIFSITIISLVLFNLLHLRASFILALILALASVMPFVGVPIGGVPAVVIAYGFQGTGAALTVTGFLVAVQAIDLLWWRRWCDEHTVDVGLFVPLVVTLIGYQLYRIGGAIYGFALAVLALALLAASDADHDADPTTWSGHVESTSQPSAREHAD
jgi:predicted PurR-regulated permease PerM